MDWLDDLLEIHLPSSFVYCSCCSHCSAESERSDLFQICWMYTGIDKCILNMGIGVIVLKNSSQKIQSANSAADAGGQLTNSFHYV